MGMAPPVGYLKHVLAPAVRRHLGVDIDVDVKRRGYFPKGGGEVTVTVTPPPPTPRGFPLPCFRIERKTTSARVDADAADKDRRSSSRPRLSVYVVDTEGNGHAVASAAVDAALRASPTLTGVHGGAPGDRGGRRKGGAVCSVGGGGGGGSGAPTITVCGAPGAGSGGSVLVVAASPDGSCVLGVAAVKEPGGAGGRGKRGGGRGGREGGSRGEGREAVGVAPGDANDFVVLAARVGEDLGRLVETGAAVDPHLLDQLIVFMALAGGVSRVVAPDPPSLHAQTAMAVAEQMTGAKFSVLRGDEANGGVPPGLVAVECVGIGMKPR